MKKVKLLAVNKFQQVHLNFIGVQRLEKFMARHHIMASKSFEDYMSGRISVKRLRIGWTVTAFISLYTIRYVIFCFYSPKWLLELTGEFSHALARIDLLSGVFICGGTIAAFRQFLNLYFEQNFKFKAIEMLYGLTTRDPKYHLDLKYYRSFCLRSRVMSELLSEALLESTTLVLLFTMTLTAVMAYNDPDMNHSVIKLSVSVISWLIWYRYLLTIWISDMLIFFFVTLFLKYSFRQLVPRFKPGGHQVIAAIGDHNRLAGLTDTLNKFFRHSLGVTYACGTPAVSILVILATMERTNVWKRSVFVFVAVEIQILMYLITYSAASISTESQTVIKHLYRLFVGKTNPLKASIKLMAFIEKLCDTFIGFYCFDFFAYTKISFYEYFFFVSSNYMLIYKALKHQALGQPPH